MPPILAVAATYALSLSATSGNCSSSRSQANPDGDATGQATALRLVCWRVRDWAKGAPPITREMILATTSGGTT